MSLILSQLNKKNIEVEHRISNATGMFRNHSVIWRDRQLPLQLKVRLFIVRILSILLYGCESWTVIMRNVRGFNARCFARVVNKQNVEMDVVESHINVIAMIEKRRWKWLGYVIGIPENRNTHRCLSILGYTKGSLLAHLPLNIRDFNNRTLAAQNRTEWMTKTYLDRISLMIQFP
jgi:hypothetical protein